jgi:hypothetical protein
MSDPDAMNGDDAAATEPAPAGSPPALDPSIFEFLLGRIEYLSRELGRSEGKQFALDRQIARLEQQLLRLERERDRDREREES